MSQTIAPAIAHVTPIPNEPSYAIAVANPQDIPYLTTIQWAALTSNPLIKTLYPHGPTPALRAFTRNSYTKALQFPSVRIIKATDIERGEIVAFAKWIKYPEEREKPPLEGERNRVQSVGQAGAGGWSKGNIPSQKPDDVDKRVLGDWNAVITQMRRGIMKSRRHICRAKPDQCSLECYFASFAPALWVLDILHTHPSHQGRGAGAQLVKWGTDRADQERLPCYLESSPAGYPLFSKHSCGFEDVTEMEIELNQYKKEKKEEKNKSSYGLYKYKHFVMIRPPPPPKVPPKDRNHPFQHQQQGNVSMTTMTKQLPIGNWDFGLPTTAAGEEGSSSSASHADSSHSDSDGEYDNDGAGGVSDKNRHYGVVGAVGGTRQEPFRPVSHHGILDSVSVSGDRMSLSRPNTGYYFGTEREEEAEGEREKEVSLI